MKIDLLELVQWIDERIKEEVLKGIALDDNELDEHDYIIVRVMAFKEVKEHIKQIYENK